METTDLLKEIIENRFLLVLLQEAQYLEKLKEIIKSVGKTKTKICYICLSRPYEDVVNDLKAEGIIIDDFLFIDVLTSHYKEPEDTENCVFLSSPTDLDSLMREVKRAVEEEECSVIVLDTVSTLLIYQESFSIIKFTHNLVANEKTETKKLFIVLKGGEVPSEDNDSLVKDLEMFADKKLDMSKE